MLHGNYPRVVVAGLAGDSGKTLVSCGLLKCFRDRGIEVSAFKKGPDYIDPAWLGLASGRPARNLDTYLMGFAETRNSFLKYAGPDEISVIEGNRGLFDGVDRSGTHSTAELAKLLQAPVIIVLNISKVTRTAAAMVLGCMRLDPELKVEGVILNHAANSRHAHVAKDAIESATGVPVIGAIPKLTGGSVLPSRHLGLVMPGEFQRSLQFLEVAKNIIGDNVDTAAIVELAGKAPSLDFVTTPVDDRLSQEQAGERGKLRIAYFKDESFSFYYPENLEMLEAAGAELIPISPSRGKLSDDVDALYIGGGFPEMNLTSLVMNREMISRVKELAENGLPIYAECGGLMYLAESIEWKDQEYRMSGVLPISVRMNEKPQGHGYCEAAVDGKNPFFGPGTTIKGHEFHYSQIIDYDQDVHTALSVSRGVGCFGRRDGVTYKNVFASYLHLHATSCPEWASGMVSCARKFRDSKEAKRLLAVPEVEFGMK
ncbi:MAG: hydrogenobyrinic acid a,c-diamide synthase (glutamine-hydrolyzing) [Bacteroidetes bacterium]|nr:hydrogenobyrinic acid a,c-diamide synthase (glutamine-hydrolyzing) [Bacteroidota bacterium]